MSSLVTRSTSCNAIISGLSIASALDLIKSLRLLYWTFISCTFLASLFTPFSTKLIIFYGNKSWPLDKWLQFLLSLEDFSACSSVRTILTSFQLSVCICTSKSLIALSLNSVVWKQSRWKTTRMADVMSFVGCAHERFSYFLCTLHQ